MKGDQKELNIFFLCFFGASIADRSILAWRLPIRPRTLHKHGIRKDSQINGAMLFRPSFFFSFFCKP